MAHLLELPHKIHLPAAEYLTVQQIYAGWALLGIVPLAAIAWSRVILDAHTWMQVSVGAGLGFLIGWILFPLLA